MYVWRWNMVATLQAAPFLAFCARALTQDQPELAGLLQGAAYAAFRSETTSLWPQREDTASPDDSAHFLRKVLRETNDLVVAALGEGRSRELRDAGLAMSTDEAISNALANIDPQLFA
jgi:hypothetical protein